MATLLDQLRQFMDAKPFVPFTVRLRDGRRCTVYWPDDITVPGSFWLPDGELVFDGETIQFADVVAIVPVVQQTTDGGDV